MHVPLLVDEILSVYSQLLYVSFLIFMCFSALKKKKNNMWMKRELWSSIYEPNANLLR